MICTTRTVFISTGCAFSLLLATLTPGTTYGKPLYPVLLTHRYAGCSLVDEGNGVTTANIAFYWKTGTTGNYTVKGNFLSRGILVYTYDKNGKPVQDPGAISRVVMDNTPSNQSITGDNYVMYVQNGGKGAANQDPWNVHIFDQIYRTVSVYIPTKNLTDWPAVAIQAGNHGSLGDTGESTGAVYLTKAMNNNATCEFIKDPTSPTPIDTNITVDAPDWNLGELEHGTSSKTLSRTDERLCFTYNSAQVSGQNFIINANSANGVVNNRYRLMHTSDSAQIVPYSLTLDNGGTLLQLPNNNSTALSLNTGGSTCFVPTFRTVVSKTVKAGDYSDTLTFTVTTKS